MKKIIFTISLLLIAISTFPDWYITRGPNLGEIYFLGLTYSGEIGLYHSTDYGQTAQCMDSTIWLAMRITADKTPGVVYYVTMVEALYISYDYGNQGTWQYQNSGVKLEINSGLIEGQIYSSFSKHSNDYGFNFINHSYNGFFGSKLEVEIDNEPSVGYVLVNQYGINDTVFLLKSVDNFENLELQYSFHKETGFSSTRRISRGVNQGELFFFFCYEGRLFLSQDYGASWTETNKYNKSDIYISDMVGGRTEGEIYTLYRWSNLMGQNAHNYILYSNDYGITYEVYHPFAKGMEPLLSQFSAKTAEDAVSGVDIKTIDSIYYVTGDMPLNVQFYNYSIGDINSCEWDFNNDGEIDSYEENPMFTYVDTGWHSVNLTVYDEYDTNSFLRENYVYIYELTGTDNTLNKDGIKCYPNPFSELITITIPLSLVKETNELLIYNNAGKIVKGLESKEQKIIWNGTNSSGVKCPPGIYYIATNNGKYSGKVLLTY